MGYFFAKFQQRGDMIYLVISFILCGIIISKLSYDKGYLDGMKFVDSKIEEEIIVQLNKKFIYKDE